MGYGTYLVELGEKWGKQNGSIEYASDTNLDNQPSQKFHKSVGFKETGQSVSFLKNITIMMKLIKESLTTQPKKLNSALLLFRVSIGGLMLLHGIGKLQDLINGKTSFFDNFDPFGLGGFTMLLMAVIAEFGCSILVILGLFTRLALVPLISTMVIAFFVFHANDGLMDKESPLLYLICFLILFLTGSGKYSFDQLLLTRMKNQNSLKND